MLRKLISVSLCCGLLSFISCKEQNVTNQLDGTESNRTSLLSEAEQSRLQQLISHGFTVKAPQQWLDNFPTDCALLKKAGLQSGVDINYEKALQTYVDSAMRIKPFECYSLVIQKMPELLYQQDNLHQRMLKTLIQNDPMKTRSFLGEIEEIDESTLTSAVSLLFEKDEASLLKWLSKGAMKTERKDSLNLIVSKLLQKQGRYNDSYGLIRKLSNPDAIKLLISEGWNNEKKYILNRAEKNPEMICSEIISSNTNISKYWLSYIYDEWIIRDPDAAITWYRTHHAKMKPDHRDFVLISFARSEISKKNYNEADQLIKQIKSKKLLAEISKEIKAARK